MNTLQQMMFTARGRLIRWEIDALKQRQARLKQEMLNRPHVPSPHLVGCWPGGSETPDTFLRLAPVVLWLRAAVMVVAFSAGFLVADMCLPARASAHGAALQACAYNIPDQ